MTYPIPDEALDDRIAIVGTSGAGKTYLTMGVMARLLGSSARVIAVDPLGVMYGLRSKPDGVTPSAYKPVIFGGPHGDLPLSVGAAALIGETCATMAESCILDLSQLGTKAAERRFMLGFTTALYRHANGVPVHIIFDEADMFAPQKLDDKDGEASKLMGMMETFIRRGRVKGFIPWQITQRPAVLNKNVLSQADGVVFMKLTSSQDRDAVGSWIEGQADRAKGKEILGLLPTLNQGEGVIWIPGRTILKTAQFPLNKTFDSSRTPKRGEARQAVDLKPLDLGKLKGRLAAVEEEAKANDPVALKAALATAQVELAKLRRSPNPTKFKDAPQVPDAKVLAAARAEGAQAVLEQLPGALDAQHSHSFKAGITAGLVYLVDKAKIIAAEPAVLVPIPDRKPLARGLMPEWKGKAMPAVIVADGATQKAIRESSPRLERLTPAAIPYHQPGQIIVSGPQTDLLRVLAWWKQMGHAAPTRAQVAAVIGWKITSGHLKNVAGSLKALGLVEYPAAGTLAMTPEGEAIAPPPGDMSMVAGIRSTLKGPQLQVFDLLYEARHAAMTRTAVCEALNWAESSGHIKNIAGSLKTLGVVVYPTPGSLAIADWVN